MKLQRIDGEFTVCKVADYSQVRLAAEYCFTGKTDSEKSLVCLTADVPANTTAREDGWRAFRVAGPLEFSLVGILARIAGAIAEEGIGIFAISTFDTDYILVKAADEERALARLAAEGHEVVRAGKDR